MLNKVFLLGYLGVEPEFILLESLEPLCKLRLATSSLPRGDDGVRETEWHNIVVFGRTALNCAKYLHSGSLIFVEGRVQSREYKDKQEAERRVTEIVGSTIQFVPDAHRKAETAELEIHRG